jgi:hypothetical protein
VSRNGGRPASLVPPSRGVSVPKSAARPVGAPVRRQGTQAATPSQTQGASPARPSAQQRKEPLRKPGAPPLEETAPRRQQVRTGSAPAEESVPRQVIPRIIPRGSSTGDTSSPGATTRQPGSSPERPNAQPAQPGGQQNGKTPAQNGKKPVRRPAKKATTGGEKPAEEKTPSQSGDGRASRSTAARASVVMARYNPYETSSTGRSAAMVGARRPASAPERVGAAPARASAPAPAPRQAVSSRPAQRPSSSQGDWPFRSASSTAPAKVSAPRGGGGGTPKAKASSGKASGGKGSRQTRRAKSDEPPR